MNYSVFCTLKGPKSDPVHETLLLVYGASEQPMVCNGAEIYHRDHLLNKTLGQLPNICEYVKVGADHGSKIRNTIREFLRPGFDSVLHVSAI